MEKGLNAEAELKEASALTELIKKSRFALALTADCIMCIFDRKRILGYLFFTLVETVYMIYMKPTWKSISVCLILYAAMLLLLWRVGMLDAGKRCSLHWALPFLQDAIIPLFCQ